MYFDFNGNQRVARAAAAAAAVGGIYQRVSMEAPKKKYQNV